MLLFVISKPSRLVAQRGFVSVSDEGVMKQRHHDAAAVQYMLSSPGYDYP